MAVERAAAALCCEAGDGTSSSTAAARSYNGGLLRCQWHWLALLFLAYSAGSTG
jgi:hypothetical protein